MTKTSSLTNFLIDFSFKSGFVENPMTQQLQKLILEDFKYEGILKKFKLDFFHPIIGNDDGVVFCQYGKKVDDNSPIVVVDYDNRDTPLFVSNNTKEFITVFANYEITLLRKLFKIASNPKSKVNLEILRRDFLKNNEKWKWAEKVEAEFKTKKLLSQLDDPIKVVLNSQKYKFELIE